MADGLRRHDDGHLRCWWCGDDPEYVRYHDQEWGVVDTDDRALFEKLCLEGFQAGLSWLTILRKRPALRTAFGDFDPELVAAFDDSDIERLLLDPGIVRNRAKITSVITNARAYLDLVARGERLADLVWRFAPAEVLAPRDRSEIPVTTTAATSLAAELKRRGWRFVGPTTTYAFMQSKGLVNDHLLGCAFRQTGRAGGPPIP